MRNGKEATIGTGTFVGAVGNAVTILRHLAHAARPEGAAQVARATGVNTSTCFNILRTLQVEGLLDFHEEEKVYSISQGMLELALPVLATNPLDLIRPVITRLSREQNSLIALWKITALERLVLVDRAVESRIVHIDMRMGTRLPSYIGALGRCVAAQRGIDDSELERRFMELRWANPPRFEDYRDEVLAAGRNGYSIDPGNLYAMIDIVAAVVNDAAGHPRFGLSAIGIRGQKSDAELHRIGENLREAAQKLSLSLFGRRAES